MLHNKNIIKWPEPRGFMRAIKSPFSVGRAWSNIKVNDLKNLVSAFLHDPILAGDTIMVKIVPLDASHIKTVEILSHTTVLTNIDAYHHNVMEKIITTEIEGIGTNSCFIIACQIYGDFWMIEGENS